MRPLELACKYMEIFYSGGDIDELTDLLAEDMIFQGPLYSFDTAQNYIASLRTDPPKDMDYRIIKSYEFDTSACLIYRFSKPGISIPMAQLFEVSDDKITRILLVFDTGVFA